jgi:hypothetical protein
MSSPLDTIGSVRPATRSRAVELADQFPALSVMWGFNPGPNEHGTGRALDLMAFSNTGLGNDMADFLWEHRVRFDVTHLIWRQRIRSTVVKPGVWRAMKDRGTTTANHMDHVHVLFGKQDFPTDDAQGDSSHDAQQATPPPYPGVQLRRRSSGTHVTVVQTQLRARGWTIEVDGSFGPGTERVVRTFQKHKGLKVDGVVGPATWAALWELPVT